jgi:3-oxoacyl-[acyl-carrier protein] reductase/2-hydroxycyclohexanecarboxyl-CoA dehydrogenase
VSVRGKTVIITGGAQGVGRYIAKTFADEGARVIIADIAPMDNVIGEIESTGAEYLAVRTNVTDESLVRSLMNQVYEKWGRIDILVNNAGIVTHFHTGSPRWPRIRDMDRAFFQKVIDTNLVGTFLCTKHALPYMESCNDGHIINVGQGNLRVSPPRGSGGIGTAVYATSKLAVRAFTKCMADEEREFYICIISMGPGDPISGAPRERRSGQGIPGAGGGIITADSPEWSQSNPGSTTVEDIGNRYVLAAEAPMELTGHQVVVRNGKLEAADD